MNNLLKSYVKHGLGLQRPAQGTAPEPTRGAVKDRYASLADSAADGPRRAGRNRFRRQRQGLAPGIWFVSEAAKPGRLANLAGIPRDGWLNRGSGNYMRGIPCHLDAVQMAHLANSQPISQKSKYLARVPIRAQMLRQPCLGALTAQAAAGPTFKARGRSGWSR